MKSVLLSLMVTLWHQLIVAFATHYLCDSLVQHQTQFIVLLLTFFKSNALDDTNHRGILYLEPMAQDLLLAVS